MGFPEGECDCIQKLLTIWKPSNSGKKCLPDIARDARWNVAQKQTEDLVSLLSNSRSEAIDMFKKITQIKPCSNSCSGNHGDIDLMLSFITDMVQAIGEVNLKDAWTKFTAWLDRQRARDIQFGGELLDKSDKFGIVW